MNADSTDSRIEFRSPWSMIPLECADDWIEMIQARIPTPHPLHGAKIFPSAHRDDARMILIENDDDGTYAIITCDRRMRFKGKRMVHIEVIRTTAELKARLDDDHRNYRKGIEELANQAL